MSPEVRRRKLLEYKRKLLGRAIGGFALAVLVVAVWMGAGARALGCLQSPCLPNGFGEQHVLALEFARTPGDVAAIVGDVGHPNRDVMRRALNRDFIFIASYLVLFLLLAGALARTTGTFSPVLTGIAVIGAICTAGFDVLENVRALRVLEAPLANLDGTAVAGILDAATIKWTVFFLTIAVLSLAFRQNNRLSKALRGLFLLTAAIGVMGLVFRPWLSLSFIPLAVGLLFLIYNGLIRPLRLIPDVSSLRRTDRQLALLNQ